MQGGRGGRLEHIEILYTPFQSDLVSRQLEGFYSRKDSCEIGFFKEACSYWFGTCTGTPAVMWRRQSGS